MFAATITNIEPKPRPKLDRPHCKDVYMKRLSQDLKNTLNWNRNVVPMEN